MWPISAKSRLSGALFPRIICVTSICMCRRLQIFSFGFRFSFLFTRNQVTTLPLFSGQCNDWMVEVKTENTTEWQSIYLYVQLHGLIKYSVLLYSVTLFVDLITDIVYLSWLRLWCDLWFRLYLFVFVNAAYLCAHYKSTYRLRVHRLLFRRMFTVLYRVSTRERGYFDPKRVRPFEPRRCGCVVVLQVRVVPHCAVSVRGMCFKLRQ